VSLRRALDNYEKEGFVRCIGNYENEIRPHDLKAQIASRYVCHLYHIGCNNFFTVLIRNSVYKLLVLVIRFLKFIKG